MQASPAQTPSPSCSRALSLRRQQRLSQPADRRFSSRRRRRPNQAAVGAALDVGAPNATGDFRHRAWATSPRSVRPQVLPFPDVDQRPELFLLLRTRWCRGAQLFMNKLRHPDQRTGGPAAAAVSPLGRGGATSPATPPSPPPCGRLGAARLGRIGNGGRAGLSTGARHLQSSAASPPALRPDD